MSIRPLSTGEPGPSVPVSADPIDQRPPDGGESAPPDFTYPADDRLQCPCCGMKNPADAVFCNNPVCHKALGEFRYALEELRQRCSWSERIADRVTRFAGRPHFVTVHVLWFSAWILVNSGMLAFLHAFDEYPFGLLGIILAVEAILITSFVLMSQNREHAYAEMRAELDYEVAVRSYRKLLQLEQRLNALVAEQESPEDTGHVD